MKSTNLSESWFWNVRSVILMDCCSIVLSPWRNALVIMVNSGASDSHTAAQHGHLTIAGYPCCDNPICQMIDNA